MSTPPRGDNEPELNAQRLYPSPFVSPLMESAVETLVGQGVNELSTKYNRINL